MNKIPETLKIFACEKVLVTDVVSCSVNFVEPLYIPVFAGEFGFYVFNPAIKWHSCMGRAPGFGAIYLPIERQSA